MLAFKRLKETMGCVFFLCSKCEKEYKKTWQAVTQHGKHVDSIEKRIDELEKQMKKNIEMQTETITTVKPLNSRHYWFSKYVSAIERCPL